MKKTVFCFAVFFLLASLAFTQENPQKTSGWSFCIEPLFGLRVGVEKEIVWDKTSNGDTYKLSELEWRYTPAWYVGSKFSLGYKRFEVSFSSKFFLPLDCGTMTDSDWMQELYYQNGNTSTKTNYSESDNKIVSGQDLELLFSFKFYPTSFLTLRPRLSVNYQHMDFDSKGGTLWYGNDISNKTYIENGYQGSYYPYDSANALSSNLPNISVIGYEIHNLYIWAGIQADFIPHKKIVISLATEAATFAFMFSYDTHYLRNIYYKEYSFSSFLAVRQSIAATFRFNNLISLSTNITGVLTGETSGPSYYKTSSKGSYTESGEAGAATMYLDIGLSLKINW